MSQRDWVNKDFYGILGVDKKATKDEIKRAYRKLAQKYHPDANKDDHDAERRFKEISEAHSVLANDERRAEYDQIRSFAETGGQRFFGFRPGQGEGNVRVTIGDLFGDESNIGDLFGDVFGFGARRPAKGRDVVTELELDLMDAVEGATVKLRDTSVRVPAGIGEGARIKVAGKGEPGSNGGPPGDLYVRVKVRPHPVFSLAGKGNLVVRLPITYAEAALGTNVEVPTLDGSVTVKVPAGTQHNTMLRVRGQGAPRAGGGRGDLLARIEVVVPRRLSKKQREALKAFAELHDESPRAHFEQHLKTPRAQTG